MGGVIWIDGIEQDRNRQWQARIFERKRIRVEADLRRFDDLPKIAVDVSDNWFTATRTCNVAFTFPDLSQAEQLLRPKELVSRFSRDLAVSDRHAIYKISDGEQNYFIPAMLLIKKLFGGNQVFERYLLLPNGADLMGVAQVEAERIRITTNRGIEEPDVSKRYARILAWLLTNDAAKRAHASVLRHAREGGIGLEVPSVAMSGWIRGIVMDEGIFVVTMDGVDMRLPIEREKVVIKAGSKRWYFKSYEPRVLSPWGEMKSVKKSN